MWQDLISGKFTPIVTSLEDPSAVYDYYDEHQQKLNRDAMAESERRRKEAADQNKADNEKFRKYQKFIGSPIDLLEKLRKTRGDGAVVLGHQTNCKSQAAKGLAEAVFDQYTIADEYRNRKNNWLYATASMHPLDRSPRDGWIANLYGQWHPGALRTGETWRTRLEAITSALWHLDHQLGDQAERTTLILPARMGCCSAGCKHELLWPNGLKRCLAQIRPHIVFTYFEDEERLVPPQVARLNEINL